VRKPPPCRDLRDGGGLRVGCEEIIVGVSEPYSSQIVHRRAAEDPLERLLLGTDADVRCAGDVSDGQRIGGVLVAAGP
jgi:hypothetical protein